jgi:hypothetical protein
MRKVLLSSAIILSLASGPLRSPPPSRWPAKPAAAAPADKAKSADCEKQWKAEKKHSQTRKAFMAACTKA